MKKYPIMILLLSLNFAHAIGDFGISDSIFFWLFKLPLGILFLIFIIFMFSSISSVESKETKENEQKNQDNKNTKK